MNTDPSQGPDGMGSRKPSQGPDGMGSRKPSQGPDDTNQEGIMLCWPDLMFIYTDFSLWQRVNTFETIFTKNSRRV